MQLVSAQQHSDIFSFIPFSELLENTDEIFYTLNRQAFITQVNRNIQLLGYSPQQIIGKSIQEIVHPDDVPTLLTYIAENVPQKKATKNIRCRMRHKNGTWRWMHASAMPVFNSNNDFLYIAGVTRDITSLVEQECQLRESEAKYRQLFYNHPIPQWIVCTQTFRFLEVNDAAITHYGYSRKEFESLTLFDILTESEKKRFRELIYEVETEKNYKVNRLHRKKNNEIIEVEVTLQPTTINEQKAVLATINDITQKRKAERKLAASELRYKEFIQQSAGGIWCFELKNPMPLGLSKNEIIDHFYNNCFLAECNDAMAQMYGMQKKEELIGKDCEFFLPRDEPSSAAFFEEFINCNFRVKNSVSYEKDIFGNKKIFLNNYSAHIENGFIIRTWGTQRDITAMHETEEKLKYLASIVEKASDAIFSTDADRMVISWNKACEELFQYKAEDVIGKRLTNVINFTYLTSPYQHAMHQVIQDGNWKGEVSFINQQGKKIYLLVSVDCVKNNEGALQNFILVCKDITEAKHAEQIIRESEERFRRLADTAPAMIWMNNKENQSIYFNQTLLNYTGKSFEEELQQNWINNLHPDDRASVQEKFTRAIASKKPFSLEYRMRRYDGQYRWIIDRGTPRYLEDGTYLGYIGISLDIHDRKTAEEQLLMHSERNTKILSSITDGFIALDNEGTIVMWNQKMEQVFGVTAEVAIGQPLINFFGIYNNTEAFDQFLTAFRQKKQVHIEQYLHQQKLWVEIIIYPFNDGYFIYFKDISERKRKELLMKLQKDVLSYNAVPGTTLAGIAQHLICGIQKILPDARISILKADEKEEMLYPLASYNLPEEFNTTIKCIPIKDASGSCGTAAFIKKPVICTNTAQDPLCTVYSPFLQALNLHSVFSFPIVNSKQKVLAVFTFYFDHVHQPQEIELELLDHILPVLLMIMEKRDAEEDIRLSNERFVLVNKATNEGIIDHNFLTGKSSWGDGFARLFGYDFSEDSIAANFFFTKTHPDDRLVLQKIQKEIFNTKNNLIKGVELRFQKANGQYAYISGTGYIIRNADGTPLRIVGAVRDITEQKKMERKLIKEMMNKQKAIHKASLEGSEKERAAISKELHDNVNQILSATKLYLEVARKEEDKRELFIDKSIQQIMTSIAEIRKLSRSLASPTLGDLGLKEAIETLVQDMHQTEKLKITLCYPDKLEPNFDDSLNLSLYRIIQEQLTNILKYAQTKSAFIQLQKKHNEIVLTVKDEGVGFDKNKVKKGLGLSNIINRASLLNGTAHFETAPGKGCTLTVSIPLTQKKF